MAVGLGGHALEVVIQVLDSTTNELLFTCNTEGSFGGFNFTKQVEADGLREAALITDGRFIGATRGACIGHVSPEAAEGGLIALIEDGDEIEISVSRGELNLLVDSKIRESRRAKWLEQGIAKQIMQSKNITSKWLKRYSLLVSNAANGAVLKTEL